MTTKFVSIKQMREIDKKAVQYGMPIELMMENTGREISGIVLKTLHQRKLKKVLVVAGKGNNADGVIAASRHLSSNGISVTLAFLESALIETYLHHLIRLCLRSMTRRHTSYQMMYLLT